MDNLRKVDLGRNRITRIIEESEKAMITGNGSKWKRQPLLKFPKLVSLDLSSNQLTVFPEELKDLLKLRELNLMNN